MNIIDTLKQRRFIEQCTNEDGLRELLDKESVKFYIGFDGTADSLTLGHLLTIMVMKHFQNAGHVPIVLLGGGTTMIGDPSGRTELRTMQSQESIQKNAEKFINQFKKYLDFNDGKGIVRNNAEWLLNLNFLNFMRDIGVNFTIARMIGFDCYKNRLNTGLTFFEMGYMLMQSYDFLELYRDCGCKLQVGGSDQWSNIIGGVELVRKLEKNEVFGLTLKLLTMSNGQKMGKSAQGALWLDKDKTHPFELFQYMRNIDDCMVEDLLLKLTFLPVDECLRLGRLQGSQINEAKEVLAYEVTKFVHGEEEAKKALDASHALFMGGGNTVEIPFTEISREEIDSGFGILTALTKCGLTKSNSEARQLISAGGISMNDIQVTDPKLMISSGDFIDGKIMLRKGKKTYHELRLAD